MSQSVTHGPDLWLSFQLPRHECPPANRADDPEDVSSSRTFTRPSVSLFHVNIHTNAAVAIVFTTSCPLFAKFRRKDTRAASHLTATNTAEEAAREEATISNELTNSMPRWLITSRLFTRLCRKNSIT